MSNFQTRFEQGQAGQNQGLSFGFKPLDRAIGGTQKARYYGIASPPKGGKSTFVNQMFLYEPFTEAVEKNLNVRWIYYSFEMSRIYQEFCACVYFMYRDYGMTHISINPDENTTIDDSYEVELSVKYLMGQLVDDNGVLIKVKESVREVLKTVYADIVSLIFGSYDAKGNLISPGYVRVVENATNPTGLFKDVVAYAESRGSVHRLKKSNKEDLIITGYTPNDPDEQVIVICDHIRKLKQEQGKNEKQLIDLWSQYSIVIRDNLNYSPVNIIHLNRGLSDISRLKEFGDMLYPDSDLIKGSGNVAEDCDHLLTIFNPLDNRYNLDKHFGLNIRDKNGDELYPGMRTIHLVESRHAVFPQHFRAIMNGAVKRFYPFEGETINI